MKNFSSIALLLTAAPGFVFAAFSDVPESHVNYEAIVYLKTEGIVQGNPDGTYRPDESISRAAFAKIIVEANFDSDQITNCQFETTVFTDVDSNQWYTPYICLAQKTGLVAGYPDGTFQPGNTINVAEAAKIISAQRNGIQAGEPWFMPYLEDLGMAGAIPTEINGIDQILDRGTMAEIIYRLQANVTTKPQKQLADIYPAAAMMKKEGDTMMKDEAGMMKDHEMMMEKEGDTMMKHEGTMMEKEEGGMMKKSAVNEDFTQTRFDALLSSGEKFVLNFSATWCPNCQKLEKTIQARMEELPAGTIILKTDYDTYTNLKKEFGVTQQTTGVFFDGGVMTTKKTSLSFDDIQSFFE